MEQENVITTQTALDTLSQSLEKCPKTAIKRSSKHFKTIKRPKPLKRLNNRIDQMKAEINQTFVNISAQLQAIQVSVEVNALNSTKKIEEKEEKVANPEAIQGLFRATFKVDQILNNAGQNVFSQKNKFAGAEWWLGIKKTIKEGDQPNLAAFLYHEAGCKSVYYDVTYSVHLLGSPQKVFFSSTQCFASENSSWGRNCFIAWSELTNYANGFVTEKGDFSMEVAFTVKGKTDSQLKLDTQFLTSGFVEHDCTLLVEGHRFPVNRGLLSALSGYFKKLLCGNFKEASQDEIELNTVCAAEFLPLLQVLYQAIGCKAVGANVIRNNVECLLRLADYYQLQVVTDRCASYLKTCPVTAVSLADKLVYAEKYSLCELMDRCVKQFKKLDDVKKLRSTDQYFSLSQDTKFKIYENIA
uniref:BTB domain-containing protein n=1 Tax=Ditylenchus dipsaci TaxID=166011 RepID=A0A915EG90_9BILA